MGAESLDAIALLALFMVTGVAMAILLLVVATGCAAMLALARGQSVRGNIREWSDRLPKSLMLVSIAVIAALVTYAIVAGR